MIYFDNAATGGRKPDSVVRAVTASIEGMCANPGRSGHSLAVACGENVLRCRKLLCSFFGGQSWERVIFTKNCTEALNTVIFGMVGARAGKTPHIITTAAEHNSILRPLFFLEREKRIRLSVVQPKNGIVHPEDIAGAVEKDTLAAVFTLASNVTGAAIDPAAVRALLPAHIFTVCDGAQVCGHIRIDMQKAGIDALCLAGHKGMHGIQGSGALLFSNRMELAPFMHGGTGSESFNTAMPAFYPDRLEAGTLSCPAAAALAEGTLYLEENLEKNAAHIQRLTAFLIEKLQNLDDVRVFSKPNPFGIVAFDCALLQSEFFAQELSDHYEIAVRGGLHCAPLMHRALNTSDGGLIRASLSEFNTMREAEYFVSAVQEIVRGLRGV